MGADKSLRSPSVFDLRLLNNLGLPYFIRIISFKTPASRSSVSPQESRIGALFDLSTILLKSLQSFIPFSPVASRRSPFPESGCAVPLFRPYVARVPWHGGTRAFLSQLFPRYGHYCGPNWSSGKAGGSLLWDRRPIDWLDFCCYCHDIGYDTHDQTKLLRADLAFLECLERPQMATKGGAHTSLLYRSMCIAGLRYMLIPYRMQLLSAQAWPSLTDLLCSWMGKVNICKQRTGKVNLCKQSLDRKSL